MNQTVSDYRFKFSVVTAVYNVEPYLAEAIESILAQDIGFEESVEIILIDDGSTDRSGAICDEYQQKFPLDLLLASLGALFYFMLAIYFGLLCSFLIPHFSFLIPHSSLNFAPHLASPMIYSNVIVLCLLH